jgi:hypothetical protein
MYFISQYEYTTAIVSGRFYDRLEEFVDNTFFVELSKTGVYTIDGVQAPTSYGDSYSDEEKMALFLRTPFLKSFLVSRGYRVYKAEKLV